MEKIYFYSLTLKKSQTRTNKANKEFKRTEICKKTILHMGFMIIMNNEIIL